MDQESTDWQKLSKKERRRLLKEQKIQEIETKKQREGIVKWVIIAVVLIVVAIGAIWAIKESSKPLPGRAVPLLGRNHVPVGTKVKYNSNPPTSGDHYDTWAKSGVHNKPEDDGYLVHSLEHGYVIISYNCEIKNQISILRQAQDKSQKEGTRSAEMKKECLSFVDKLKERVKKDSWKFILIPRPNLDTNFALTSWGRIDKFNTEEANIDRVNNFVRAFRNAAPEKTME